MMMKNPNLKKQSQNLRGKNKKSSKKLKVWEAFSAPEVPSGVRKKSLP